MIRRRSLSASRYSQVCSRGSLSVAYPARERSYAAELSEIQTNQGYCAELSARIAVDIDIKSSFLEKANFDNRDLILVEKTALAMQVGPMMERSGQH